MTLLHHAAASGCVLTVKALLDKGADINASLGDTLQTPLHLACLYGRKDVALALIERGANKKSSDRSSKLPLYLACLRPDMAAVIEKLKG